MSKEQKKEIQVLNDPIQTIIKSMCKSDIEFFVTPPKAEGEEEYHRSEAEQFADEAMDN